MSQAHYPVMQFVFEFLMHHMKMISVHGSLFQRWDPSPIARQGPSQEEKGRSRREGN